MNIVLIGMPGAGKSTIGVLLAKALGMNYVDTDIIIQQYEGRLLQDIIDNNGLEEFMELEERIVSGLQVHNCVIATGGSVIYSEKVMASLRLGGKLFYLQVPYEELVQRLSNLKSRGIVIRRRADLRDVYDERVPLYIRYADEIVDCAGKGIEGCVEEILKRLNGGNDGI